jgi:hypothetical protein
MVKPYVRLMVGALHFRRQSRPGPKLVQSNALAAGDRRSSFTSDALSSLFEQEKLTVVETKIESLRELEGEKGRKVWLDCSHDLLRRHPHE